MYYFCLDSTPQSLFDHIQQALAKGFPITAEIGAPSDGELTLYQSAGIDPHISYTVLSATDIEGVG